MNEYKSGFMDLGGGMCSTDYNSSLHSLLVFGRNQVKLRVTIKIFNMRDYFDDHSIHIDFGMTVIHALSPPFNGNLSCKNGKKPQNKTEIKKQTMLAIWKQCMV